MCIWTGRRIGGEEKIKEAVYINTLNPTESMDTRNVVEKKIK